MLRPLLLAVVCLASSARAVRADDHIPGHVIDRGTTGVVIAGALTAALEEVDEPRAEVVGPGVGPITSRTRGSVAATSATAAIVGGSLG